MKINWKACLHSGPFWVKALSLVLTAGYGICSLLQIIPKFDQKQLMDVIMVILNLLSLIGVISSPASPSDGCTAAGQDKKT